MGSKGDDALSNPGDAPEKDQTLILTLPQDQESAGDADGTIKNLRDEIQALRDQKGELELRLDDSRKKLHRAEADNHCLAAKAKHLEEDLAAAASSSKDFETETDSLKRALKDLEADVASLATAKAAKEAEISALGERLLSQEELEALQAEIRALERKDVDLRVEVRHSEEQRKAAVKEQVKITKARVEEGDLVVRALEEANARMKMELAECRSQIGRHLEMQGGRDVAVAAATRRLRVSQVVAVVASVGALAAVAVTVYLHRGNRR
ncbi:tropomyosin alpha-1 chain-like [Cocos nucifera]|uniref:Tropomyosin alpha-1 chain-like n=1 Tax=Cocos nucifera TaxID=13894 RepID=A0A8K0NCY5_COCNU|nr:tropomyosin alpha-1 chain-like [Cocos nucifera]